MRAARSSRREPSDIRAINGAVEPVLVGEQLFARHYRNLHTQNIETFGRLIVHRRLVPPVLANTEAADLARRRRILAVRGREIFTTYVPDPKGPDFMTLIERTFGKELTTRTWETVTKVAR